MSLPPVEQLLTGSGLLYLVIALLGIMALAVRALSDDKYVRRRALLVIALLVLFAILQAALTTIPERMSGFVPTPTGERVPGLVENPVHRVVSVVILIAGLLALLMTTTLLLIDFLMVRQFRFEIPNILRDVAVFALFFVGVMMILYNQTDLDVTGLFTTSAVISIVIGLALQDTLGNVFSGLALQTERSFNVGDWVQFGDREGVVTDISWRATKLRTRSNDLVIIPNSLISKDIVINFSAPTRAHAVLAHIGAHYRHPPADVIRALEDAADQTDGILNRPKPDVRTVSYGDFAIDYEIKYWIRDYAELEDIKDEYMTLVWYAFRRHGIEIPYPIRDVNLRQVTPETEEAVERQQRERVRQHLRRVSIFDALTDEEAHALADRARTEAYFRGETVLRQGEAGDSLYIIDHGMVEVVVSHNGRSESLAQLGPSAFFGEISLMTGAERTATVVTLAPTDFVVIDRAAFRDTLERNPDIAFQISETLAARRQELEATHAALDQAASRSTEEERRQILGRIREFFGFKTSEEQT